MLGNPAPTKLSVFLTLFKQPLNPPPSLVLNIYVADFSKGLFFVNLAGTTFVGPHIIFFGALGISAKFRRPRTKIRGTSESKVGIVKNGLLKLDDVSKNNIGPKRTAFLAPKRAPLGHLRPFNSPPSGRMGTKVYRVTSGCGIVVIPFCWFHRSPKSGGYMGKEKKCRFLCQKWSEIGSGGYPRDRRASLSMQTNCFFGVQTYWY